MTDFVIEQAKVYGLDLTTAHRDDDGVCRANICPPLQNGHWELTSDKGWVHLQE